MTKTPRQVYWEGFREGLPFIVMVAPFSMLFSVIATEAGLSIAQTMGFSVLVIAGAAQFAALQMMTENAAFWLILLAALAVNLRMAMYSAALAPYLGKAPFWQKIVLAYVNFDQTFAMSVQRYEAEPDLTVQARVRYFLGAATPLTTTWCVMSYVGVKVGQAIPMGYGFDFIMPIAFIALVMPMLRTVAHMAAALMSIIVALLLSGLPSGAGLLIAAAAAMATGAAVETWIERARA